MIEAPPIPYPPTTLLIIAHGYTFETADRIAPYLCVACKNGIVSLDKRTGLCRSCWRHWRWSPSQERGIDMYEVPPKETP